MAYAGGPRIPIIKKPERSFDGLFPAKTMMHAFDDAYIRTT